MNGIKTTGNDAQRNRKSRRAERRAKAQMEAAMAEINQWNRERDYPYLEMGIGMDCGEVIVGNIGSEKRMKYGVVGSHVNLCGRIESYTAGGQILISPDLRERVSVPLEIEKEMRVLPKGSGEEFVLSQVTGIGAPYDIRICMENNYTKKLDKPIPICFYIVDGKHIVEKACYGGIVAIGNDCAVLETETQLELYDNLRINAGGHLLCKVMEANEQSFLGRYTSIPSGYGAWQTYHCGQSSL